MLHRLDEEVCVDTVLSRDRNHWSILSHRSLNESLDIIVVPYRIFLPHDVYLVLYDYYIAYTDDVYCGQVFPSLWLGTQLVRSYIPGEEAGRFSREP